MACDRFEGHFFISLVFVLFLINILLGQAPGRLESVSHFNYITRMK